MITIVTDSTSYIKKSEARELGVRIIPMSYTVSDQIYGESYSDQNGDFENLLSGSAVCSTSQPNMSAFLSCFEEELSMGNEVLCITISSRLSGTYSTAYMAARQIEDGGDKVIVVDSHNTAGGLYILVKAAQGMVCGGLGLADIKGRLIEMRDRILTVFSVEDMDPLRRSGRIGFVRMSVGTILNKRPILLLREGAVVSSGMAHGDTDVIRKLVQMTDKDADEFIINYIGNNRLAANLYGVLKNARPSAQIGLHKAGPVLGIHLGMNVISVSYLGLGG